MASSSGDIFEQLFDRYYDRLVGFFRAKGVPCDEARDLAQEAFFRAFRRLGSFEGRSSFRTWLFAIAENLWKNSLRRRNEDQFQVDADTVLAQQDGTLAKAPAPGWGDDPLDMVLRGEGKRHLRAAIDLLPPRMRQALRLRIYHEMRYKEIACIMQISIETVKPLLHQAKLRLRSMLVS